jgi:hypothetical protein
MSQNRPIKISKGITQHMIMQMLAVLKNWDVKMEVAVQSGGKFILSGFTF